jgi:lysophospholipase L1-like esterase
MVGGVWVQAHRAAHAELPEYDDLDVTGYYGPDPEAGARHLRVAAVGDSTLTGPGLDHARDTFVARVAAGAGVPLHMTRHAVGGSRVADVLMGQLPAVLDTAPDLVVLSIGANDAIHSTPLLQFERDLRAVVGALDRAGIETLVCGLIDLALIPRVPPVLRTMLRRRGEAYERRKARATHPAARAAHVAVGRRVNEVFRARGEAFFTPDRFHPNGSGHGCLAEALAPHFDAAAARAWAQVATSSRFRSCSGLPPNAKYTASNA